MSVRPKIEITGWATEELYPADSGPDEALATKVTPSAGRMSIGARKNWHPPAQEINRVLYELVAHMQHMKNAQAQNWRPFPLIFGDGPIGNAITDTVAPGASGTYIVVGDNDLIAVNREPLAADGSDWEVTNTISSLSDIDLVWVAAASTGVIITGSRSAAVVYRSTDEGQSWASVALPGGSVGSSSGIWDEVNQQFVVATLSSGRIVTSPNGSAWTSRTATGFSVSGITGHGIVADSSGNYSAVSSSSQVFRSTDAGVTWSGVSLPSGTPRAIAIDEADGRVVVVGDERVFVSVDGGAFASVVAEQDQDFRDVQTNGAMWVATALDAMGIFYSVDFGETWQGIRLMPEDVDNFGEFKTVQFLRNAFHVIGHGDTTVQGFRSLRLGDDVTDVLA